jgi:hypothetical protein
MSLAELPEVQLHQEMDFAAESALAARLPARRFREWLSPSQRELRQAQAVDPAAIAVAQVSPVAAELIVAPLLLAKKMTIEIVTASEIVERAAQLASSQIIAPKKRTQMPRRKSRPAQPSAIAFAPTSPAVSHENLILSPRDFIGCYCCGPKFRMAAAACRRM